MNKFTEIENTKEWLMESATNVADHHAYSLVDRLEVESELKTREYVFSCGTRGEVIDEITVKIKVPRLDIQPSNCSEEEIVNHFIKSFIDCEVSPYLENAEIEE